MVEPEKVVDDTKLDPEIEAEIAVTWADNMVAAQLTRTVARAMVRQGKTVDMVREMIQNSGRVVD
ncbi:MAG: hypothetical protein A4C66_03200 [Nitrospira sp. HN-bin3]|uniref:hypothetical protein n=1 Tax=Nitrospira cf. moscoviensis SBR1015 TaxID=96242 RepID=UPI000A09E77F|nr:hypothetical protein [Nitrospira cf. moscoviensis SBR1015]OQW37053.1 MAG: hypothetical protein A4C66_03200 [Nitrospira sp. HN-bin3]